MTTLLQMMNGEGFKECIANPNEGIVEKTRKIQRDYIQILKEMMVQQRISI